MENRTALYVKLPKPTLGGGSLWDYTATVCLFNESKACNGDVRGQELDLNPSLSTYFNHCGVLFSSDTALRDAVIDLCKNDNLLNRG